MIDKEGLRKLAAESGNGYGIIVPSQDVLELLSESSRLASRAQELEEALQLIASEKYERGSHETRLYHVFTLAERALAGKKEK